MALLLINTMDGTVTDLQGTVLVDTEKLDAAGTELLEEWYAGGNDGTASELGEGWGKSITKMLERSGFGDLTYANTMAFSPQSLKEEIQERLDNNPEDPTYIRAAQFTDEELEVLGSYIMGSDYLWSVYSEEFYQGIRGFINEIINNPTRSK